MIKESIYLGLKNEWYRADFLHFSETKKFKSVTQKGKNVAYKVLSFSLPTRPLVIFPETSLDMPLPRSLLQRTCHSLNIPFLLSHPWLLPFIVYVLFKTQLSPLLCPSHEGNCLSSTYLSCHLPH